MSATDDEMADETRREGLKTLFGAEIWAGDIFHSCLPKQVVEVWLSVAVSFESLQGLPNHGIVAVEELMVLMKSPVVYT